MRYQHSAAQDLVILGVSIRRDAEGRYCLNDLHRSAGGEKRHQPSNWLAIQQVIDLNDEVSIPGIPGIESKQGLGTFVAKELVYAYAMWISASFHLKVIRAYDELVTGKPAGNRLPTRLELARDLVSALEREEKLESELAIARPKAEFHDEIAQGAGEFTFTEIVATVFNNAITVTSIKAWAIRNGWLQKFGKLPTKWAVSQGLMRQRTFEKDGMTFTNPVVTGKGMTLIRHLYRRNELFTADIPRISLMPPAADTTP